MDDTEHMTRHYRILVKYTYGLETSDGGFDLSQYISAIEDANILEWANEMHENLISGGFYNTIDYTGRKNPNFFSMIIRKSVGDYKQISRFDNVNWIITKVGRRQFEFIISLWDENYSIERLLKNIWGELCYRRIVITGFNVCEIGTKGFMKVHYESVDKGFEECSTAWLSEAGRFDYIHELYEDDD